MIIVYTMLGTKLLFEEYSELFLYSLNFLFSNYLFLNFNRNNLVPNPKINQFYIMFTFLVYFDVIKHQYYKIRFK